MKENLPIITLLTDFGLEDEYVGVMKGVILSINNRVHLVDITHSVGRHDVMQAALVINASFRYFPKGSIHIVVVDPGVGGKRKVICLKKEGHFFLAPDNGILSLIVGDGKVDGICQVTNQAYFLTPVSGTFHGRDIFAPVAAHLSSGVDMFRLGEKTGISDIVRLDIHAPSISSDDELIGEILSIDRFGNLVTNIDFKLFETFIKETKLKDITVNLGKFKIKGVSGSYEAVEIGSPVALFGSRNSLEISVNQGDARIYFGASVGQTVRVSRRPARIP